MFILTLLSTDIMEKGRILTLNRILCVPRVQDACLRREWTVLTGVYHVSHHLSVFVDEFGAGRRLQEVLRRTEGVAHCCSPWMFEELMSFQRGKVFEYMGLNRWMSEGPCGSGSSPCPGALI